VKELVKELLEGGQAAFEFRISPDFLFRSIQSQPVAYQFHVAANGVTRYGLSQGSIKDIVVPVPPLEEQVAIVRMIEHVERLIKRYTGLGILIGKQAELAAKRGGLAGQGIALLIEYRTALMANLVTGKIDVREAAARLPPEGELLDEINDLSQDEVSALISWP